MKALVRVHGVVRGRAWPVLLSAMMIVARAATAEDDIHDIRGPKVVVQSSLVTAVIAAVAIVAAVCIYVIRQKRRRVASPPSLSLSEQTLQSLEHTRSLMSPATAREFGIAASEVIRKYIERRFNVIATQRTTEEFLQTLLQGSNETLARHRAALADFLQQCDFVKFAGTTLAVTDMEGLLQSARGFVLQTSESAS